MKKSIDEIVNNENYTRLNSALRERVKEIAAIIRGEMGELEIDEIGDYSVRTIKSRSGYSNTSLYILTEDGGYANLEQDHSCHLWGDWNCWSEAATTKQRLQFLNCAKELFEEIDRIKEDRCAQINEVLNR